MTWVLRWRMRKGVETPVVEPAKGNDVRWNLGRETKREVIEASLRHMQKNLESAQQSVRANEQYIARLEKLLAKEPKA